MRQRKMPTGESGKGLSASLRPSTFDEEYKVLSMLGVRLELEAIYIAQLDAHTDASGLLSQHLYKCSLRISDSWCNLITEALNAIHTAILHLLARAISISWV